MKDVADRAGVSVATVSHVINKTRNVSVELQNRVYEAMNALQYRPDAVARGLKTKRTYTIGLLISDITNPFYPMIVRGVEDFVHARELSLILCNTDEDLAKQSLYIDVLLEKRVDGIICTPAIGSDAKDFVKVDKMNIPLVSIDQVVPGANYHAILTDNYNAAYQGTSYLISQGHRKILLLHGPHRATTGEERYKGYRDAILESGLDLEHRLTLQGDFRADTAYVMVKTLLQKEAEEPTAVFSANAMMTLGVLRALKSWVSEFPQDMPSFHSTTQSGFRPSHLLSRLFPNPCIRWAGKPLRLLRIFDNERQPRSRSTKPANPKRVYHGKNLEDVQVV